MSSLDYLTATSKVYRERLIASKILTLALGVITTMWIFLALTTPGNSAFACVLVAALMWYMFICGLERVGMWQRRLDVTNLALTTMQKTSRANLIRWARERGLIDG